MAQDPLLLDLDVPYVCDYHEYCQHACDFLSTPERHHLQIEHLRKGTFNGMHSDGRITFLQGWLFFTLLKDISTTFGVDFAPSDFILPTPSRGFHISMTNLKKYIWFWIATQFGRDRQELNETFARYRYKIDILNEVTNAWTEKFSNSETLSSYAVIVSIMILGDTLALVAKDIFQCQLVETSNWLLQWSYPSYAYNLLIQAGWCVGELSAIMLHTSPTVLIYLTTIDRTRQDKDHSLCSTASGCLANQLDVKTYETSHAADCLPQECRVVEVPVEATSDILSKGGIPLVCVNESDGLSGLSISVYPFVLGDLQQMPKYVAISHVWSDGMGNPGKNALRACQLRRIQLSVSKLCTATHHQKGSQLFWMDTLCVPLSPNMRSLAISRMAKTFFHADKVLVLDTWLCSNGGYDAGSKELLVKIARSDWNSRLWTFQEVILAKNCHFQLHDKALTIDDLKDVTKITKNLQGISNILDTIEKDELLQKEYTLRLLRALTSVDISALTLSRSYADLPPQIDPNEEELRLNALQNHRDNGYIDEIFAKWFPILAEGALVSAEPEFDDSLRTHLEVIILDPIISYGTAEVWRLRGRYYELSMSRSEDTASRSRRQLTRLNDVSPCAVLQDIAWGLSGRMTSRMEDETICLGGILGLDITPLLTVTIDEHDRLQQVKTVQAERMKIFLSIVKEFPSSIVFWKSPRLEQYPWRWAPLSFLEEGAGAFMLKSRRAFWTSKGLLGSYSGIRIVNEYKVDSKSFPKTLVITYTDCETASGGIEYYPFRRSWTNIQLSPIKKDTKTSHTSWPDCFAGAGKELAILVYGRDNFEGIVVDIVKIEGNVFYTKYLANVSRVYRTDDGDAISVKGSWVNEKKWCIG